jgi:hypothetical protein
VFQSSKNPFGGGSGSEKHTIFAKGVLLISSLGFLIAWETTAGLSASEGGKFQQ